jgi:hypothetical protein
MENIKRQGITCSNTQSSNDGEGERTRSRVPFDLFEASQKEYKMGDRVLNVSTILLIAS